MEGTTMPPRYIYLQSQRNVVFYPGVTTNQCGVSEYHGLGKTHRSMVGIYRMCHTSPGKIPTPLTPLDNITRYA